MIAEEAYLGPSSIGQALEVLACAKLILLYMLKIISLNQSLSIYT